MQSGFLHPDIERFVSRRVDWEPYFQLRAADAVDVAEEVQAFMAILRSTAEVCADIGAASRSCWHDAARLEGERVVVPEHVVAGYTRLRSGGLLCPALGVAYGGLGLPFLLSTAILEMVARANPSLMTIVGLQAGVATDIERYGSDEIKRLYLPRFASGELQGAMDLTEPGAGSDLSRIVTRVTGADGRLFVDGEKIFITNGGSDVHLVLARDASTVRCYLRHNERSEFGLDRNAHDTWASRAIRASARPASRTRNCAGRPAGSPDTMARLGVAAQGVGIAEAAYQEARSYAATRIQFGRALLSHPLMTAMLADLRVCIQAARAVLYRTAALVDRVEALQLYLRSDHGRNDASAAGLRRERLRATRLVRVLTALSEYFAAEMSHRVTRTALQVHGGLGYHVRCCGRSRAFGFAGNDHLRGDLGDPGDLRHQRACPRCTPGRHRRSHRGCCRRT